MNVLPQFPLDVTAEEATFGFRVVEMHGGIRALVADLGNGLRVVKVNADRSVHYQVCDGAFQPLYGAATSLDDLTARFTSGQLRIA